MIEIRGEDNRKARYIDGQKVTQTSRPGHFSGTIEAYTYSAGFQDSLTSKRPKSFGLSYRTEAAKSYKLHLAYNVLVAPSTYIRQQQDTDVFRWPFTTMPIQLPDGTWSSHLEIDTSIAYPWAVAALEDILYGTEETEPRLPLPAEVLALFEDNSILQVTDHGDGSFTIEAPDYILSMVDGTTFEVTWPSVILNDADTYTISSL